MNSIKDQDLSKNQILVRKIVMHAVDQVNFTIRNLLKRSTVSMLIECENSLTDFMPVIKLITEDHIEYDYIYDQMCAVLDAVQTGQDRDLVKIEFALSN